MSTNTHVGPSVLRRSIVEVTPEFKAAADEAKRIIAEMKARTERIGPRTLLEASPAPRERKCATA